VILECFLNQPQIKIDYPSISCRGVWELKSATSYRAEFVETINEELDNCGDQVLVVVTRIDERFVGVAFFLPEMRDVVAAYTVLTRVEEKKN
jgi:hypothetical protein